MASPSVGKLSALCRLMRGREALYSKFAAGHLIHRRAAVPLPHQGEGRAKHPSGFACHPLSKEG